MQCFPLIKLSDVVIWIAGLPFLGQLSAAGIAVPAGNGTLAAAIASAADGDTLVLGEGAFQGGATINKSLTLRPVNRATNRALW